MTKKDMMKAIAHAVGPQEAIRLVAQAYDTEILSNRLSRMETEPSGIKRGERRDLLLHAMERVMEVVGLA